MGVSDKSGVYKNQPDLKREVHPNRPHSPFPKHDQYFNDLSLSLLRFLGARCIS